MWLVKLTERETSERVEEVNFWRRRRQRRFSEKVLHPSADDVLIANVNSNVGTWGDTLGSYISQTCSCNVREWETCSVTRLGNFWKFLVANCQTKVTSLLCENCCGYLLGNFWQHLGYFLLQHLVILETCSCNVRERYRSNI